jgi:hypothetical protein
MQSRGQSKYHPQYNKSKEPQSLTSLFFIQCVARLGIAPNVKESMHFLNHIWGRQHMNLFFAKFIWTGGKQIFSYRMKFNITQSWHRLSPDWNVLNLPRLSIPIKGSKQSQLAPTKPHLKLFEFAQGVLKSYKAQNGS